MPEKTCKLCGGPVPTRGRGPAPSFCSEAHRKRYTRAQAAPPTPGQTESDPPTPPAPALPSSPRKRGAAAVAKALAGDGVVTMATSFVPKPGAYVLAGCPRHPKAVADSEGRCQTCRLERAGSVRA